MTRLKIEGAKLPVEGDWQELDLLVEEEKVIALGHFPDASAEEVWKLTGRLILPGAVDPHVHLDDPGFTWREDFSTGTLAAARGGVTTIIDMPETSVPNCRTTEGVLEKIKVVEKKAHVDFALWGGVTGEEVRDGSFREKMTALSALGVVGFKVYTTSGMDSYPRVSYGEMREILKQAAHLERPVALHAEDWETVSFYTEHVRSRGGKSFLDYLESRPPCAEEIAISAGLLLAEETGAHLHIVHISTAKGVDLIAQAKVRGLPISAETCPHYLILSQEDFPRLGALMKTTPPVRNKWDQEALWQGLQSGVIDLVATDHASAKYPEEKEQDDFFDCYAGIPGLETFIPLLWEEGYVKGRLTLERLIQVTGEMAARIYGLWPSKGRLGIGSDADFIILNPKLPWQIRGKEFASKGGFSPFDGRLISTRIEKVVLRGKIIFPREEEPQREAEGRWIQRR